MANTTSNIGFNQTTQYQAYYDKKLLQRLLPNLVYTEFGEKRPLPKSNTKYIQFRRFESLAAQTTPLNEGANPSAIDMDDTLIQTDIKEFGAWSQVSSLLELVDYDPVITKFAEVYGENAADSLDQYTRDILVAGTYFIRIQAGGTLSTSGNRNTVAYSITKASLDSAILQLEGYNVKKFESIIAGSTGVGTSPVPESYICIVHPHVKKDILALGASNGIIPAFKYSNVNKLYPGEFAAYEGGIRFLSTTNGKIWTGAGANGTTTYRNNGTSYNVYGCIVMGQGFYATTELDGGARIIVKPKSIIGGALERFSTVGWQANYQAVILNDYCGVRIECAATL